MCRDKLLISVSLSIKIRSPQEEIHFLKMLPPIEYLTDLRIGPATHARCRISGDLLQLLAPVDTYTHLIIDHDRRRKETHETDMMIVA